MSGNPNHHPKHHPIFFPPISQATSSSQSLSGLEFSQRQNLTLFLPRMKQLIRNRHMITCRIVFQFLSLLFVLTGVRRHHQRLGCGRDGSSTSSSGNSCQALHCLLYELLSYWCQWRLFDLETACWILVLLSTLELLGLLMSRWVDSAGDAQSTLIVYLLSMEFSRHYPKCSTDGEVQEYS